MAALPATYDVAGGFVAKPSSEVWEYLRDIENWPAAFPDWIASVEADDDRFHIVGIGKERYDFYPHADSEQRAIDVEAIDELGSADTLKLRVLDMPGGSLVIVAHGRLAGTSDADWVRKRSGVAEGLAAL